MASKTELEKRHKLFEKQIASSESFWKVFSLVVQGRTYATAIATKLQKNKSLVARQLHLLNDLSLLDLFGTGIKQFYAPNWTTFAHYWIWTMEGIVPEIPALDESIFAPDRFQNWLGTFYFHEDELKEQKKKDFEKIRGDLEPLVPHLLPIVQKVGEKLASQRDISNFYDAFLMTSVAFGAGLPPRETLDFKGVSTASSKDLLTALYSPKIQTWLKLQVLARLASSNIVRNHVLRMTGQV